MARGDLPPLDTLPTFVAVSRQLSFTRAASALFITQSAVSKQIGALESALGLRLFDRQTRALRLTPAGERLLAASEKSLSLLREAVMELTADGQPTVTLTCTPAFASFWLIPRLDQFRRAYPGVDIRVSADTRVVDFEKSPFDLAIRYMPDEIAPAHAVRLAGGAVMAVCSPTLLAKQPLRRPKDLAHHVLLSYQDEEKERPYLAWPAWLEVAGLDDLRPAGRIVFNNYESVISAVIGGQGVALVTRDLVANFLRKRILTAPLPQRYVVARSYFLLRSTKTAATPAVDAFYRWLAEYNVRSTTARHPRTEGNMPSG